MKEKYQIPKKSLAEGPKAECGAASVDFEGSPSSRCRRYLYWRKIKQRNRTRKPSKLVGLVVASVSRR